MTVADVDSTIAFGRFRLLRRERQLLGPSGRVELSSRAFEILLVLLERADHVVTKSELLDLVWPGLAVEENNLQVHVWAIRKALGKDLIATVSGRGYKYVGERPREVPPNTPDTVQANSKGVRAESERSSQAALERGNLPDPLTSLVGREDTLANLFDMISKSRIVTIVGPGGVGKTRLAVEAAHRHSGRFADGIWFVDLCPVQDGSQIPGTIARSLRIPPEESEAANRIWAALRDRELLIVLDNCEHLIEAAALAANELLCGAPAVRVLATSREPLEVPGERILSLLPLEFPPVGARDSAAILRMSAVQLFLERVASVDQNFVPGEHSGRIIGEICQTLDGLPLAIEMAASRVPALGLSGLAVALRSQLRLQMKGARTALPRHRTLQATLGWSWDLLEPPERVLLRRLAVFPGRFQIAAAHAVSAEDDWEQWELAERLGALVRKSLVAADKSPRRFRMLDTVRAFALAKLDTAREQTQVRLRHARWILASLNAGIAAWEALPDADWLERFGPDLDDCRAALRWSDQEGEHDLYAQLASASFRLWLQLGIPAEGLAHAKTALGRLPLSGPQALQAQASIAVAELAAFRGLQSLASETMLSALPLCRALGDPHLLAAALVRIGFALDCRRQHEGAEPYLREAGEIAKTLSTPKLIASVTMATGLNRYALGDLGVGIRICENALEMHRLAGDELGHRRSLLYLAEHLFHRGDCEAAIAHGLVLVSLLRTANSSRYLGFALCNLAAYLLAKGRSAEARQCLIECYGALLDEGGTWPWCAAQHYALVAAQEGSPRLAARLLGYADRRFSASTEGRQQTEHIARENLLRLLKEGLSEPDLITLQSEGAMWSQLQVDEAVQQL